MDEQSISSSKSRIGRAINLLVYKLTHRDKERARCIRYLQGKSHAELQTLAEQFYQEYLLPRKIEQVWKAIGGQQSAGGNRLVIVSGTLDIIAEKVARHIGAEAYYATEMLYNNDLFTGGFRDFLLAKSDVLPHYNGFDIITDNLTDIDLVRHAQQATIITYNNKSRWQRILPTDINVTFIEAEQARY